MAKRPTTKTTLKRSTPKTVAVPDPGTGDVVGVDPHKRTLTATVLDCPGRGAGHRGLPRVGRGHRALEAWATGFGPVERWGIEGAASLGRHTAMHLIGQGHDVRDVCPDADRRAVPQAPQGKTDAREESRQDPRSR